MSDEVRRYLEQLKDGAAHLQREKMKKGRDSSVKSEEMLEKRRDANGTCPLPNKARLSRLLSAKTESDRESRSGKEESRSDSERILIRDKLQEKLGELLDEQQALIELYMKAARAAREKEEEYNERITDLMEQTEKDRQLMDLFRGI